MGGGQSYEREFKETQKSLEEMEARANKFAEKKRKAKAERLRMEKEAHEKELRRAQDDKEQLQKIHKLQEEAREYQERLRREEEKTWMNEQAKKIAEEARERVDKEICLREEAEKNLAKGIPPPKYPTGEEFEATRKKLDYRQGDLHFAITGVSGAGKSSLINAFRGYSNSSKDPAIARAGVSETTEKIGRYIDPARPWLVWYDVPGAGTAKVPSWQYFNDQGLYIFDIIIIVIGDRFTAIDLDLLFNCKRFGIPAFLVRSKANTHITNLMNDDSDGSEDEGNKEKRFRKARDKLVTETHREFKSILEAAGLPLQRVYIISKDTLHKFIKNSKVIGHPVIDEVELMKDISHVATTRRDQPTPQNFD